MMNDQKMRQSQIDYFAEWFDSSFSMYQTAYHVGGAIAIAERDDDAIEQEWPKDQTGWTDDARQGLRDGYTDAKGGANL